MVRAEPQEIDLEKIDSQVDSLDPHSTSEEILKVCSGVKQAIEKGVDREIATAYFKSPEGSKQLEVRRREMKELLKKHNHGQSARSRAFRQNPRMQGFPETRRYEPDPKPSSVWSRITEWLFGKE